VVDAGRATGPRSRRGSKSAPCCGGLSTTSARQHEFARSQARGEWGPLHRRRRARLARAARRVPGGAAAYSLPFKNHYRALAPATEASGPTATCASSGATPADTSGTIVHEKLIVEGPVARLDAPILHYTYDSLQDCLAKMERYGANRLRACSSPGAARSRGSESRQSGLAISTRCALPGEEHARSLFAVTFIWREQSCRESYV